MLQLLKDYKKIISSFTVDMYEVSGDHIKLRMRVHFIDESLLAIRETIISGEKRKYSYHWQDKNQKLIKRWDNAPDWEVETFPHHLHTAEGKVEASYDRSIEKILEIIKNEIT